MKVYTYKNNLGTTKKIEIYEDDRKDNKIFSIIKDSKDNYCSSGYNTEEELKDFLKHYGIEY